MKSHVQVAVIGGGVVGASVLYHLTKAGWRDVVLVERNELTSGSTWHAAGGMHTINGDPNVAKLQQYTINLYKEIEEISGQSCGLHMTTGITLAASQERMDWLKLMHGRGRYLGMGTELVTADEAAKLFPLMDKKFFVGGLFNPMEGHVDPSGVTQAYAKAARVQGAEVYRFNRVTDLQHRPDGSWDVITEQGNIHAERIAPSLEIGFEHFPPIGRAGIKKIVNGPFTFAPDGNPLVGPVRGLKNYWCACAVMAGFSQGGGVGLALANWMVHGDPGFDVWAMDVSRFGDWAGMAYTNAKVRENYSRRFRIRFPNEELPAARPLRTTPIYDRLAAEHAVFGDYCALEHALWFAPTEAEAVDQVSFRRSNAHPHIARECTTVRDHVGLLEISNYGKFEVQGPAAAEWLSKIMANRIPSVGRIALSPMLNDRGKLIGDFTLCRIAADHFFLVGTYAAETYYLRWFERHLPLTGVTVRPCAMQYAGLSVAGPESRALH